MIFTLFEKWTKWMMAKKNFDESKQSSPASTILCAIRISAQSPDCAEHRSAHGQLEEDNSNFAVEQSLSDISRPPLPSRSSLGGLQQQTMGRPACSSCSLSRNATHSVEPHLCAPTCTRSRSTPPRCEHQGRSLAARDFATSFLSMFTHR